MHTDLYDLYIIRRLQMIYKQYINGEFVESNSKEVIEVFNPATNEKLSTIPNGDAVDAQRALDAAKNAQDSWEEKMPIERAGYLKAMANVIRENRVHLANVLAQEQAKVFELAQIEVDFTAEYFDYYAGWARIYEGEIINSDRPGEQILLFKKAMGVVVGICPWNFPFFVMARKVAPALLTGSTIVIKPSSETPNTTFEFAKLLEKVELPKGVLNIISGSGSVLGEELCRNDITDMITVTGSVSAGQKIIEASAKNIVKLSLELGGKAPVIVCNDADLDLAVSSVVQSRLIFSGQVCNCAERVYVEEGIADEFTKRVTEAFKNVKVDEPFSKDGIVMSSLVSKAQLDKVTSMVEKAKEEGATVAVGGNKDSRFDTGFYFEPTLLTECRQDMQIVQEEVFGPVLPIIRVKNVDEAIKLANDSDFGLTSSVYSQNINTILKVCKKLKYGETYVNREHFEAMQGFHAGWRKSGLGGADGKHGLEEFLQTHVVYMQEN